MRRLLLAIAMLILLPACAHGREAYRGWCEEGNQPVITSGLTSTSLVQLSHPLCLVTVYNHGGGVATIYSDNNNTPLTNPFTAQTDGQFIFYANNGRYDVTNSQAGFTMTITYFDVLLCDPFDITNPPSCGGGGGGGAESFQHNGTFVGTQPTFNIIDGANTTVTVTNDIPNNRVNMTIAANGGGGISGVNWLHNEVLVANEPGGDFKDGTNLTWTAVDVAGQYVTYTPRAVEQYQNNGSAVGAEPILNLIAGTNVTLSPFTDAGGKVNVTINSTAGGTGCTLPGNNLGVLSEHPANTCYDSPSWTWDDTNTLFQASAAGSLTTITAGSSDVFEMGLSNAISHISDGVVVLGDANVLGNTLNASLSYVLGNNNTINTAVSGGGGNQVAVGDNNVVQSGSTYILGTTNTTTGASTMSDAVGGDNSIASTGQASILGWFNKISAATDNVIVADSSTTFCSSCWIFGFGSTAGHMSTSAEEVGIAGSTVISDPPAGTTWNLGANFTNNLDKSVGIGVYNFVSGACMGGTCAPQQILTETEDGFSIPIAFPLANASSTGTTLNKLVKLTGAPSTGVIGTTGDTNGFVGICTRACGTTGSGVIAMSGLGVCIFDGNTTAGHYVQESTMSNGECTDAGASFPASGQVIGRVLTTNVGTGTYALVIFPPSR